MLYRMPSRLLSTMFRNLTVPDGFVLAITRFNFENCYKLNFRDSYLINIVEETPIDC